MIGGALPVGPAVRRVLKGFCAQRIEMVEERALHQEGIRNVSERATAAICTNILGFTARVLVNSAARGHQRAVTPDRTRLCRLLEFDLLIADR